jgi:hypothetical protein
LALLLQHRGELRSSHWAARRGVNQRPPRSAKRGAEVEVAGAQWIVTKATAAASTTQGNLHAAQPNCHIDVLEKQRDFEVTF